MKNTFKNNKKQFSSAINEIEILNDDKLNVLRKINQRKVVSTIKKSRISLNDIINTINKKSIKFAIINVSSTTTIVVVALSIIKFILIKKVDKSQ